MDNRKIVVYHNKIVINNYTSGDIPSLERLAKEGGEAGKEKWN